MAIKPVKILGQKDYCHYSQPYCDYRPRFDGKPHETLDHPMPVFHMFQVFHPHDPDMDPVWFKAIVDTGADFSMLPYRMVSRFLRDLPKADFNFKVAGGGEKAALKVTLRYRIPSLMSESVHLPFLICHDDELLIGRNILNNYAIRLHWPKMSIYARVR
jgi:hypothetical protein